jgi:hypothetical protein
MKSGVLKNIFGSSSKTPEQQPKEGEEDETSPDEEVLENQSILNETDQKVNLTTTTEWKNLTKVLEVSSKVVGIRVMNIKERDESKRK